MKNTLLLFSIIFFFSISPINGVSIFVENFIKCLDEQFEKLLENRKEMHQVENYKRSFDKQKNEILQFASQCTDSYFFDSMKRGYEKEYRLEKILIQQKVGADSCLRESRIKNSPELRYYSSMLMVINIFKQEMNEVEQEKGTLSVRT